MYIDMLTASVVPEAGDALTVVACRWERFTSGADCGEMGAEEKSSFFVSVLKMDAQCGMPKGAQSGVQERKSFARCFKRRSRKPFEESSYL